MASAAANEQFERCASLRDQINKLQAQKDSASAGPTWDDAAYEQGLARLNTIMKEYSAAEAVEKCAAVRNQKQHLNDLKSRADGGDSAAAGELANARVFYNAGGLRPLPSSAADSTTTSSSAADQ